MVPKSLEFVWLSEFEKYAPNIPVTLFSAIPSRKRRIKVVDTVTQQGGVLIVTYHSLMSNLSLFSQISSTNVQHDQGKETVIVDVDDNDAMNMTFSEPKEVKRIWSTLILDEGHLIKNPSAKVRSICFVDQIQHLFASCVLIGISPVRYLYVSHSSS